jgi:hypothetical protein
MMVLGIVLFEIVVIALKLAAILKIGRHNISMYILYMNILLHASSELYSLHTFYMDTNTMCFGHVLFEILNHALNVSVIFQNGRHIVYWH